MSLGGPAGPTTQRGKQKSRQNATKHGIFAVGIVRRRESVAEYLKSVEDMVETVQPMGRLEEILVEKLAMLVWRYRRLLQAEAAEVARETEFAEEGN
jgi:DNA-binding helix-hairpin-helix protein with protein kinase domain